MIRKAAVAGSFYPADKQELLDLIQKLAGTQVEPSEAIGAVVPHAGYIYSGPVTIATLSRIKLTQTVVLIGPNHTGMGRPFAVMTQGVWQTPLGEVQIDTNLAKQMLGISRYLEEDADAHQLEHSIEVILPVLQFLKPEIRIVPIALAGTGAGAYKEIGSAVSRAVKESRSPAVLIASSDMTHYEPHDSARQKDFRVIDAIMGMDEDEMLRIVREQGVSMCGYGPVSCMMKAARELGANKAELVKYQTSGKASGDYSSVVGYAGIILKAKQLPAPVELARKAVDNFVREHRIIKPPSDLPEKLSGKAGVFVSLHKGHELRGCIGTFSPARSSIAEEIIINAIHSATEDPRFTPVAAYELAELTYSVDVLSEPEPVDSKDQLDPVKYGVIVESGLRRGLLLPDLEGVETADRQIEICRMKAGIGPFEPVQLYRFEVTRYR